MIKEQTCDVNKMKLISSLTIIFQVVEDLHLSRLLYITVPSSVPSAIPSSLPIVILINNGTLHTIQYCSLSNDDTV
jgi:hypothetical protein